MAGGLAGSVVRLFCNFLLKNSQSELAKFYLFFKTVLVLKYILHNYPAQFTYYGYANVSQSVALMLSAVVLWIAHNTSSEYEYNLTL